MMLWHLGATRVSCLGHWVWWVSLDCENISVIKILVEISNTCRSFAIMAVPFGLSTTFAYSLTNGQSVTVLWGWVFVSIISMCIAASLAEICAVYPTAGGVYYWSAMLSTKEYAPVVSWYILPPYCIFGRLKCLIHQRDGTFVAWLWASYQIGCFRILESSSSEVVVALIPLIPKYQKSFIQFVSRN